MAAPDEIETSVDTKDRRVCSECIEDQFLRREIQTSGFDAGCFYCRQKRKAFSIDQLADRFDFALKELFYRTLDELPNSEEVLSGRVRRRAGQPVSAVISEFGGIDYEAAEDVRQTLAGRYNESEHGSNKSEECPFDPDAHYAWRSADALDFDGAWFRFELSLKTENRYFNREAEAILASIFEGIDSHRTTTEVPIVTEAGPGTNLTVLYRARVFQDKPELIHAIKHPEREVGPPPRGAGAAGRMNAAGVAVFYGATDPGVALAEVQPPVGSKVLVGCFEIIRTLRLLDLEALALISDEEGSIFDEDHIFRLKRAAFLRGLSAIISKPVMPSDEPRDYLPTQAVVDFLASNLNPPLDGIIYPSVQAGHPKPRRVFGPAVDKRNVVLFQKSARVRALGLSVDAEVSFSDESWFDPWVPVELGSISDSPERTYAVFETVSNIAGPDELDDAPLKFMSLEIHHVHRIQVDTVHSQVARYRKEPPSE